MSYYMRISTFTLDITLLASMGTLKNFGCFFQFILILLSIRALLH